MMKLLVSIIIMTFLTTICTFFITTCQFTHYKRVMSDDNVMNTCKSPNVIVYDTYGYMVCVAGAVNDK